MDETTINLLTDFGEGDPKAFERLFLLYYPRVRAFIDSMLNDADTAKDLAQDTFVQLWKYRAHMSQADNPNAYVYQTAKHILFAYLHRQFATTTLEDGKQTPSLEDIEATIYNRELEELIECAIDRMPPQRKQVFCMSRKEGLSNDEISQRLNISKRTVETHISMALATLRKVVSSLAALLFFLKQC